MKKTKKILLLILMLMIFCYIMNNKVYAITNYQYNVSFDYTCTYIVNTSSTIISSEQNVKEAQIFDSHGKEVPLSIVLKTNKEQKNNQIKNGSYISSDELEIQVITNYEDYKLYLYDSSNNEIASSGTETITITNLVDDTYNFKVFLSGAGNYIDNRTYELYKTECSFSFTIDTTPPIIKGASLYMDGIFCNSTFEISGYDEGCGINTIYMLAPFGDKYQSIGTEIELSCSKTGIITFYAVDNVGNRSKLYYVYNDITKPTGLIKDNNGNTINNSYTESDFYYEAKDSDSNISYMEYKKPNSDIFEIYDGHIISNTNVDGVYQFRSYDNAGNVSEITEITLFKVNSVVEIIYLNNSNKVYLTWENDEYKVTINNKEYKKNTILSDEGVYNVEIENKIGNISYLSFTISCYYTFLKTINPTCQEEGYLLYSCISCGKIQKANFIKKIAHSYEQKSVPSTCQKEGGLINFCIYCNEYYFINNTPKLKHDFDTYCIVNPMCETNGLREYKCKFCSYTELKEVKMKGHSMKFLMEEKNGLSTTIYNFCENCGEIEANSYQMFEEDIIKTIENIINSYFNYLLTILLITSSIWSLFIGIKIIISYTKEEKDIVKKMVKNYIIGIIVIFIIIVAIPYLVNGIVKII